MAEKDANNKSDDVAARTVLDIAELLEAIILELPLKDLLLSQRVNRMWKATIASSPRLQEALFFRVKSKKIDIMSLTKLEPNPLLLSPAYTQTEGSHRERSDVFPLQQFRGTDHPNASWLKMHLTRPSSRRLSIDLTSENDPLSSIIDEDLKPRVRTASQERAMKKARREDATYCYRRHDSSIWGSRHCVENEKGVTAGDLAERAEQEASRKRRAKGTVMNVYLPVESDEPSKRQYGGVSRSW